MKSIIIIILIVQCAIGLVAQDEAFMGGAGDGFSLDEAIIDVADFAKGDVGDGFSTDDDLDLYDDLYNGGSGDGFAYDSDLNDFSGFCSGGSSDGFSRAEKENNFFDFTSGGVGDGQSHSTDLDNFNDLFSGGSSDGFAYDKYGHIIYWTGNVGTGWNVEENWENDVIPNYCNPVVIPDGVPNYPAVNAGVLRIGYYKDEGDYRCQKIKIEPGAEMTTRVNCYVENYDHVFVQGILFVKNPATDAFKNFESATLRLYQNANIIFKE